MPVSELVGWVTHQQAVRRLQTSYAAIPPGAPVRLAKPTSNLFRARSAGDTPGLDVSGLTGVVEVDVAARTADVQGMCTYEDLVDATLPHGLIPLVVPQLRSITLGGAVTGLGIESTSFRNGLPHESVREMDVLTGAGEVVTTRPGERLFDAFANSYGSLGYAVRLRIELEPVPEYVGLRHVRFEDLDTLAKTVETVVADGAYEGTRVDGLDGVVFAPGEAYLTLATWVSTLRRAQGPVGSAPRRAQGPVGSTLRRAQGPVGSTLRRAQGSVGSTLRRAQGSVGSTLRRAQGPVRSTSDYTGQDLYYRSLQQRETDLLTMYDYLWRWDTDWFWCSGAFGLHDPRVRRLWPRRLRRSDVYHRLVGLEHRFGVVARLDRWRGRPPRERVIQDIEVPVEQTPAFLSWFDAHVGMRPVWLCPLRLREPEGPGSARIWPSYPLHPGTTYVNIGFWGTVPIAPGAEEGALNRAIEARVSELGGHKSLYSDAYYDPDTFERLYGVANQRAVKALTDPDDRLTSLYEKAVKRR